MEMPQYERNRLIAKFYQRYFEQVRKKSGEPDVIKKIVDGIFTSITKERILGLSTQSGRDRTIADFWFDVRERVKMALIDLDLFIEFGGEDNIEQVLTEQNFEPIVNALLWGTTFILPEDETKSSTQREPDANRAEIAQLFIKYGFQYLCAMRPDLMTLSHENTKNAAIDLADFLTEAIKPKEQKHYSPPKPSTYSY